jgi:dTDP-4-amino-4,6-dideoxygalactose transaminase
MVIRALGLDCQSEVITQVDTCSAVPQAILNSQAIPVFTDVDIETFQICQKDLAQKINKNTKMILATHMWGNPEDLASIKELTNEKEIFIVEDACLALGSRYENRYLGSFSTAGVFSFGSTKPLQAGEGGMIVTDDKELARELRSMRSWGDRETEYGLRDVRMLSWNGRMPEVIAAIALEQLKGYPDRLERIQERVKKFRDLIKDIPDFIIAPTLNQEKLAYTQVALKITPVSRYTKQEIFILASEASIPVFHATFEPLTELSLFRSGDWLNWTSHKNDRKNPAPSDFLAAYDVYQNLGVGLVRKNFESDLNFRLLCAFIKINFKS